MEPEPESSAEKSEGEEYLVEAQEVELAAPVPEAGVVHSYLLAPLREMPVVAWYVLVGGVILAVIVAVWPNSLDEVGSQDTSGYARGVAVAGGYAYVADYDEGLVVVGPDSDGDGVADVSDAFPSDPEEWADSDGDGVGDNGDAFPETAWLRAWWQVGFILLVLVASGAAANYGYGRYRLARRVSGKVDELRAKIVEFKEKGINTDELERVLAECEAEMGAVTESEV